MSHIPPPPLQGVTKSVFKGVMDLLKYLVLCLEEELQRDPESSTFSMFLILRLSFSIYLPPKTQKSTIGISLLNALNLNSFITSAHSHPSSSADDALSSDSSDSPFRRRPMNPRERKISGTKLPAISISDTDEETEELHILHSVKKRGRRGSSPLITQRKVLGQGSGRRTLSLDQISKANSTSGSSMTTLTEGSSETDGLNAFSAPEQDGGRGTKLSPLVHKTEVEGSAASQTVSEGGDGAGEVRGGVAAEGEGQTCEGEECISTLTNESAKQLLELRRDFPDSPTTDDTETSSSPKLSTPNESLDNPTSHLRTDQSSDLLPSPRLSTPNATSPRLSPLEASVPPSPQRMSSPDPHRPPTGGTGGPVNQALLLSDLINSPRFYHPREGQDLSGCTFLYKELLRSLGSSREFMLSRHFWNQLFISTLTVERENLGWNEWTVCLYEK